MLMLRPRSRGCRTVPLVCSSNINKTRRSWHHWRVIRKHLIGIWLRWSRFKRLMEFSKLKMNLMSPGQWEELLKTLRRSASCHRRQRIWLSYSLHFIVHLWSSMSSDSIVIIKVSPFWTGSWTRTRSHLNISRVITLETITGRHLNKSFWNAAFSCTKSTALLVIMHPTWPRHLTCLWYGQVVQQCCSNWSWLKKMKPELKNALGVLHILCSWQ